MQPPSDSPSNSPSNASGWLARLKPLKGVIVGIAGVGAVLSGLVGYYTTYKAVALPDSAAAPSASAPKGLNSKSIAVLPFANMSGDPAQEYFSDGVSEELINQLSKIADLFVIARTSSFSFKGKPLEIDEIAKRLNVAHILQGSIRRAGNRVRITAQLIRAADSIQIWSESYDRNLDDIFAVQDEISGAVVEQLKVKLLGAAPKAQVVNTQAYALLLQARAVSRQGSDESFNSSIDLYKQALKIDPTIADAWVELSQAYESRATTGNGLMESDLLLSREVLQRALALNPNSPGVYCRLASLAEVLDNDLPRDAKYLNQALRLAPDDEGVLRSAAILSGSLGRLEQLLEIRQFLIRRDPARAGNYSSLGYVFERLGRWDEATASLRKALTLSPSRASTHYSIAMILLAQGQAQLALAEMNEEPETSAWRLIGFPLVWHALGDKAKSDAALAELIRKSERGAAFQVAEAYAYRGEPDKAFEWLGKAVRYRDPGLRLMVTDTLLVNLHADTRWLPFLRKIGRAPEQLAAIQLDVKLPAQ